MKFEISPKEYETELNWSDAILYCSMLDINGFGWRLPTLDELNEIYNSDNDFERYCYWTSTEIINRYVWAQDFSFGDQNYNFFNKNDSNYVRAIRSIKIGL